MHSPAAWRRNKKKGLTHSKLSKSLLHQAKVTELAKFNMNKDVRLRRIKFNEFIADLTTVLYSCHHMKWVFKHWPADVIIASPVVNAAIHSLLLAKTMVRSHQQDARSAILALQ